MVTTFVAILAFSLLFVAGFVVDGGRLLNRYVQAHDLAANAARAGAQKVDEAVLYAGGDPVIAQASAQDAASGFLNDAEPGGTVTVTDVSGDQVTVQVSLNQSLMMLPGTQTVTASATATAQRGVESALAGSTPRATGGVGYAGTISGRWRGGSWGVESAASSGAVVAERIGPT